MCRPLWRRQEPRAHGESRARPGRLLKYSEMTCAVPLEAGPAPSQRVALSLDKRRREVTDGTGEPGEEGSSRWPLAAAVALTPAPGAVDRDGRTSLVSPAEFLNF